MLLWFDYRQLMLFLFDQWLHMCVEPPEVLFQHSSPCFQCKFFHQFACLVLLLLDLQLLLWSIRLLRNGHSVGLRLYRCFADLKTKLRFSLCRWLSLRLFLCLCFLARKAQLQPNDWLWQLLLLLLFWLCLVRPTVALLFFATIIVFNSDLQVHLPDCWIPSAWCRTIVTFLIEHDDRFDPLWLLNFVLSHPCLQFF